MSVAQRMALGLLFRALFANLRHRSFFAHSLRVGVGLDLRLARS
jgi:hypothetical protein